MGSNRRLDPFNVQRTFGVCLVVLDGPIQEDFARKNVIPCLVLSPRDALPWYCQLCVLPIRLKVKLCLASAR